MTKADKPQRLVKSNRTQPYASASSSQNNASNDKSIFSRIAGYIAKFVPWFAREHQSDEQTPKENIEQIVIEDVESPQGASPKSVANGSHLSHLSLEGRITSDVKFSEPNTFVPQVSLESQSNVSVNPLPQTTFIQPTSFQSTTTEVVSTVKPVARYANVTSTDIVRTFMRGKKPGQNSRSTTAPSSASKPKIPNSAFSTPTLLQHSQPYFPPRYTLQSPSSRKPATPSSQYGLASPFSAQVKKSVTTPTSVTSQGRKRSRYESEIQDLSTSSIMSSPSNGINLSNNSLLSSASKTRNAPSSVQRIKPDASFAPPKSYSDTAKKILQTLDQLSSPLIDSKRQSSESQYYRIKLAERKLKEKATPTKELTPEKEERPAKRQRVDKAADIPDQTISLAVTTPIVDRKQKGKATTPAFTEGEEFYVPPGSQVEDEDEEDLEDEEVEEVKETDFKMVVPEVAKEVAAPVPKETVTEASKEKELPPHLRNKKKDHSANKPYARKNDQKPVEEEPSFQEANKETFSQLQSIQFPEPTTEFKFDAFPTSSGFASEEAAPATTFSFSEPAKESESGATTAGFSFDIGAPSVESTGFSFSQPEKKQAEDDEEDEEEEEEKKGDNEIPVTAEFKLPEAASIPFSFGKTVESDDEDEFSDEEKEPLPPSTGFAFEGATTFEFGKDSFSDEKPKKKAKAEEKKEEKKEEPASFSFGFTAQTEEKKEEPAAEAPASGFGFSFGAPAAESAPSSVFDTNPFAQKQDFFVAAPEAKAEEQPVAQAPAFGFSFGAPAAEEKEEKKESPKTEEKEEKQTTSFSFGDAPSFPASTFQFETSKALESAPTPAPTPASAIPEYNFSFNPADAFGASTVTAPASTPASASTPSQSVFAFGQPETSTPAAAGDVFSFGKSESSNAFNFGQPAADSGSMFNFGGGSAASSAPFEFGSGGAASTPTTSNFNFGGSSSFPAPQENTNVFAFGTQSSNQPPQQDTNSVFAFGASNGGGSFAFGSGDDSTMEAESNDNQFPSSSFTFGQTNAATQQSSFGSNNAFSFGSGFPQQQTSQQPSMFNMGGGNMMGGAQPQQSQPQQQEQAADVGGRVIRRAIRRKK